MCGRYLFISEEDELRELLYLASFGSGVEPEPNDFPSGEIFPGTAMPIITDIYGDSLKAVKGSLKMILSVWGIPMYGKKRSLINARREGIVESPVFSALLGTGRCVIPASGYYEWDKPDEISGSYDLQLDLFGGHTSFSGKTKKKANKYLFTMPDGKLTLMAGLYGSYNGESRFTVITGGASGDAANIHERMPLLLTESSACEWMRSIDSAKKILVGDIPEPKFALAG
ncbi:MAG: SOS response-associated peptidase [Clostridiales bacterium]|nr:SOS response-associated peptidase [Clostridiales bacterium]